MRVVGEGDKNEGGFRWSPRSFRIFYLDFKSLKVELWNDTGKNKTDRVTTRGQLKITGRADDSRLEFQHQDGSWRGYQPPFKLGKNTVKLRQRALMAQDYSLSPVTTFEFTLVKKDQDLPLLNAPEVKLANDTGEDTNDGVTTDDQLKIGGLVRGAVAEYQWQDGSWHKKQPVFELGKNTVQVRQRADDGSVSPSTTFQFKLVKELNALEVKLANDTGKSNTDRRTHDPELKIGGFANKATVEYQWGKDEWRDKPPVFKDGSNLITVRQSDSYGNKSKPSTFKFILLRKKELQPPVISLKMILDGMNQIQWGSIESRLIQDYKSLEDKDAEIEYKFDQHTGYAEGRNGQQRWHQNGIIITNGNPGITISS